MKRAHLSMLFVIFLFWGCSGKDRTRAPKGAGGPVPLSQLSALLNEVFPLANGNAYLENAGDGQLFLLSKDKAARVDGVDLQDNYGYGEVYPLSDGAAYLVSSNGHSLRLYYLLADKAALVQEAPIEHAANGEPASREGFLWAQMQAALAGRRAAEAEAAEAEAASEPDD